MKEIKFRAWDKELKKLSPVKSAEFIDKTWVTVFEDNESPRTIRWDRLEIMQYTGLKDRNGKEVYEGDLIKHNGYIYEIVYNSGGFTVKNTDSKTAVPASNDFLANININVIGNIYENPELLEKKV